MLFQKRKERRGRRERRDAGGMPAGCVGEHARRTDTYNGDKDNFNGKGITHKERGRYVKHTEKGRGKGERTRAEWASWLSF